MRFWPARRSALLWWPVLFLMMAASCGDARGTRLRAGQGELFYADGFPEPEASALMAFLRDSLRFFSDRPITLLVDRTMAAGSGEPEYYTLKMVCETGKENDADFRKSALAVSRMVSEQVFGDRPVHFVFVNDRLETKGNVPFTSLGKRYRAGGLTVYAADGVGDGPASAFAQKASQQPFMPREAIFRLRSDSALYVSCLAGPDMLGDSVLREQMAGFVQSCLPLFGERPAAYLEFSDIVFEPLESVRLTPH
jgi:hypothetical protein